MKPTLFAHVRSGDDSTVLVGSMAAKSYCIVQNKILTRYNEIGLEGLTDRSRRPYRQANQLPFQIEARIVSLKKDKPSWGAPKIREKLNRLYPDAHTPARPERGAGDPRKSRFFLQN